MTECSESTDRFSESPENQKSSNMHILAPARTPNQPLLQHLQNVKNSIDMVDSIESIEYSLPVPLAPAAVPVFVTVTSDSDHITERADDGKLKIEDLNMIDKYRNRNNGQRNYNESFNLKLDTHPSMTITSDLLRLIPENNYSNDVSVGEIKNNEDINITNSTTKTALEVTVKIENLDSHDCLPEIENNEYKSENKYIHSKINSSHSLITPGLLNLICSENFLSEKKNINSNSEENYKFEGQSFIKVKLENNEKNNLEKINKINENIIFETNSNSSPILQSNFFQNVAKEDFKKVEVNIKKECTDNFTIIQNIEKQPLVKMERMDSQDFEQTNENNKYILDDQRIITHPSMMITSELLRLISDDNYTNEDMAVNNGNENNSDFANDTKRLSGIQCNLSNATIIQSPLTNPSATQSDPTNNSKTWSQEDMENALDALRNHHMSLTKASSKFGIPSTTLWQRARRLGIDTPKKEGPSKTWNERNLHCALQALRAGTISANKASKVYGIPSSTLYKIARREGIRLAPPFNAAPTAWRPGDLERALHSIRCGHSSVQRASTEFGIPIGTLYGRCKREGIELSRTNPTPWSENAMSEALEAVRLGQLSINQAAIHFNLPYSSLYGRLKKCKYEGDLGNIVKADHQIQRIETAPWNPTIQELYSHYPFSSGEVSIPLHDLSESNAVPLPNQDCVSIG